MKKILTRRRLWRLIVAICCTAFSYIGLAAAFVGLTLYKSFNISAVQDPSFYLFPLLWSAAWIAYFLILFFWIKNGYAPKPLMVIGTILGTLSTISTVFWGLIFALPAIVLMIYVLIQSVGTPQAA